MDKIIKKKGPGTSEQLLFRLQKKFRKIPLLVMYSLIKFDDVINSWCHKLFQFNLRFESGNFERERKNYKNVDISKMKRLFSEKHFL